MQADYRSVLIAKTDKLHCDTLANCLRNNGHQVWMCHTELEIAPLLRLHKPAVVFVGHNISKDNLTTAITLKAQFPAVQFVVFTRSPSMDETAQALGAGISGCFHYDDDLTDLLDCLEWLQRGSSYLSPTLRRWFLAQTTPTQLTKTILSKREAEIMALVAQKRTSQQIADQLFVSIHTVQKHRKNIKDKLSLKGGKNVLAQYLAFAPPPI